MHKCPRLKAYQRIDRFNWATANQFNNFENTIFADETSFWENDCPFYHHRPKGSYPDSVEISSSSSRKLNLWCAISCRGHTAFVVKFKFKIMIILKKFIL